MQPKLSIVCVRVSDMERALAFYRDRLGLALHFSSPHWAEFDAGPLRFALYGGGQPSPERRFTGIAFQVDDLAAAVAELRAQDVPFTRIWEDDTDFLATLLDPDNNELFLHQRKPGK